MKVLVTGATGFLGSHVAEALTKRGDKVRALARPSSDTAFLKSLGVEIVNGDLTDAAATAKSVVGVDAIVHAAAKVGDWGPIEEYRKVNVEAFERLLDACVGKNLKRIVLVSSLGVYEAKDHFGTDETSPPPAQHFDGYTQTKVEAEGVARRYVAEKGLPIVIVRPGFIYGERDRTIMPRILFNLKWRLVTYFGSRKKKLNNVYVGNVVEGILLALEKPGVIGEAFNLTDGRCVTKQEFFESICKLSGLPRPLATYPMWFARFLCQSFEKVGKTFGFQPILNMARLKFMGLNLDYSIEKARRKLGYDPSVPFETGIARTIDWLRQEGSVR